MSPGPIDTISARGISGFTDLRDAARASAPLGRASTIDEIGSLVSFLSSPGAAAITGQTLYVDCGLSVLA